MKKLSIVLIIVMMAIVGLAGCKEEDPTQNLSVIKIVPNSDNSTTSMIVLDESNVTTVGNNSYIAINKKIPYVDFKDPRIYLEIIEKFEKIHNELVVNDWKIEIIYSDHWHDRVLGIWVHHRPKTETEIAVE